VRSDFCTLLGYLFPLSEAHLLKEGISWHFWHFS
jgi:hypothetical protein